MSKGVIADAHQIDSARAKRNAAALARRHRKLKGLRPRPNVPSRYRWRPSVIAALSEHLRSYVAPRAPKSQPARTTHWRFRNGRSYFFTDERQARRSVDVTVA